MRGNTWTNRPARVVGRKEIPQRLDVHQHILSKWLDGVSPFDVYRVDLRQGSLFHNCRDIASRNREVSNLPNFAGTVRQIKGDQRIGSL